MRDKSTVNKVIKLLEEGYSSKEIQTEVGVSPSVISHICKEYDVNVSSETRLIHKYNAQGITKDLIAEELKNMGTYKAVAKKLGISATVLRRLVRALEHDDNTECQSKDKITREQVIEQLKQQSITTSAKHFHISWKTLQKLMDEFNITEDDCKYFELYRYAYKKRQQGLTKDVLDDMLKNKEKTKIQNTFNINIKDIDKLIKFYGLSDVNKTKNSRISKELLERDLDAGLTKTQIMKKHKVAFLTVNKLINMYDLNNKVMQTANLSKSEYIEQYRKKGITRDLIKNDIDKGMLKTQIASKYNIALNTLNKLINMYDLKTQDGRKKNISDNEYIEQYRKLGVTHNSLQKYFNQGLSKPDIRNKFNISEHMFNKLIHLLNVQIPTLAEQRFYQLRNAGWTKSTVDKLREHYTDAEIAQRCNLSSVFLQDFDYLLSVPDMKNTVHYEDLFKTGELTRELVIHLLMKNRCNQFALRDQLTQKFNVYMPRETFRAFLKRLDIPKKYFNNISHDKQMKTILKRFDLTPRKLAKGYDNNLNVTIDDIVNRLNSKLEFWEPLFSNQWFMNTVLPLSKNKRVTAKSREELSFSSAIQAMFPNMQMNTSDRNVIAPRELDLYVPELKLGIEFNGDYWHSDKMMKKSHGVSAQQRHQEKVDMCNAAGVHVLFVWEKQWKADKFTVLQAIKDFANTGVIAPMLSVLSDENKESLSELSKQAKFNHAHGIDKNKDTFLVKLRKLKQDVDYSGNRNYNYYMHVLEENNTSLTEFKEIVNSKPKTQIAKDLDLTIYHLNTFIKMLGLN